MPKATTVHRRACSNWFCSSQLLSACLSVSSRFSWTPLTYFNYNYHMVCSSSICTVRWRQSTKTLVSSVLRVVQQQWVRKYRKVAFFSFFVYPNILCFPNNCLHTYWVVFALVDLLRSAGAPVSAEVSVYQNVISDNCIFHCVHTTIFRSFTPNR